MPAEKQKIYMACPACGGKGKMSRTVFDGNGNPIGTEETQCAQCEGSKHVYFGYLKDKDPD